MSVVEGIAAITIELGYNQAHWNSIDVVVLLATLSPSFFTFAHSAACSDLQSSSDTSTFAIRSLTRPLCLILQV